MRPAPKSLWPVVCAVFIFTACQKEGGTVDNKENANPNQDLRTMGMVQEDLTRLSEMPSIMSSGFRTELELMRPNAEGRGGNKGDKDSDGIPDASDACPTQKETMNGYQDGDGCPDTVPTNTDTDGDGILNTSDACPTQAENFNGFQDADGCPDVLPDTTTVLPPTTLPSKVDLVTPPIGYQGGEGSCVPFTIGYAARSIEQYYKTNASSFSYSTNIFSPEYLYNQTKFSENCASGTSVTKVLDFMKLNGVCTWQAMPYENFSCSLMPNSTQNNNASNYKIASYAWMFASDVTAVKTMLVNKHAVIIGINPDQAFMNAGPGFIWSGYQGGKVGAHAVAIVGYDDSKNAYKIMNSWGTGWGDAGYSWITYDFFPYTGAGVCYAITGL